MSDLFDVTATVRLPGKGKATVTLHGTHDASIELTQEERQTLEDLLTQIIERRRGGRHG